jgi:hypothetical protein
LIKKIALAIVAVFAFSFLALGGIGVAQATPVTSSASGTAICTTDANGLCIINHDLGTVPNSVVANAFNDQPAVSIATDAYTATYFRIKAYGPTGAVVNKKSVKISWAAFAGPAPTTTPTGTPTTKPTTPPTTVPTTDGTPTTPSTPPTTTPPTTAPTTTPPNGDWPSEANTGPASDVVLTAYTGPKTITTANTVIDSKTVSGDLDIKATGVVIKNSVVNGEVSNYDNGATSSFTIQDSIVKNGARDACMCIGSHDFTALRVEVIGGNRGMYCEKNCKIQDSYVHDSALQGEQHGSAIRVEQNTTLIHNKLACDWTDLSNSEIGCSADMTGYPDFAPIKNNTIDNNYFVANPKGLGFCAYGGGTNGKPYSSDPTNGTNIKFTNNVFEHGKVGSKLCGTWGAITDFYPNRTGNVWTNNKWDDGSVVDPA